MQFRPKQTRGSSAPGVRPSPASLRIHRKGIRGVAFKAVFELGQSFRRTCRSQTTELLLSLSLSGRVRDRSGTYTRVIRVWCAINTIGSAFGRARLGLGPVRVRLDGPSKFDGFKTAIEGKQAASSRGLQGQRVLRRSQSSGLVDVITALGSVIAVFFGLGAVIGAMITMYAAVAKPPARNRYARARSAFSRFSDHHLVLARVGPSWRSPGDCLGALASLRVELRQEISMLNFTSWSEIVIAFPEPDAKSIGVALLRRTGFMAFAADCSRRARRQG